MFRTLYGRLLTLFVAVLLTAMALLSVLLYQRIRSDKMESRLDELESQARDIAYIAAQTDRSEDLNRYMMWKGREIMRDFDAYILIMDRNGNVIPIGDSTMEFTYDYTFEQASTLIGYILSGGQIRARLPLGNGSMVFTVGVPYVQDGEVLGAVFIHTSEQNIESSYKDILAESIRAMMIAIGIGAVMMLVIAQLITRPLRQMAAAADRFARGDFDKRVPVESRDEVGRLAEALNRMAAELDQLEQTRRGFVANVSHELRSPLTSIQGFINGILDGTVPEAEREHYLEIVLDETKRMSKLITTLLDLSHMDSGQTEIKPTRFDINEMIVRVLFRQETRVNDRGMDVEIDFEDEQGFVLADADRIEQVVVNLIDNAIKYGRDGGKITLSTKRENGHIRVTVADDGQGIPAEDLPHVFDRFYKADKAHTKGLGTGLGLSIVKSIIDQHGQTIDVSSEEGNGTTFSFTLERAKKEALGSGEKGQRG